MLHFKKKMLFSGGVLLAAFIALLFLFLDAILCRTGGAGNEICLVIGKLKIAAIIFGGGLLFLYSLFTWILFNRLSRPLQKINDHILSYSEKGLLPLIPMDPEQKGEFAQIASILNAMTEKIKKQMDSLKLSSQETVEILESLGEGVISVDSKGITKFANEAACKLLGVPLDGILGAPLSQIEGMQKALASKGYEAIQDVLQTSEIAKQNWEDRSRGRTHLEFTAVPRPGQRGAILVLKDKSADFKVLEMGKDFIANASHELRTPITIIRGFAETLQDHPEISPQILREIIEKIVRTSHLLENLVKSLLTLADIENVSQDQMQTTDLVTVAEHCKAFASSAYVNAKISLTKELDKAPVLGDAHLLDLALMNLLENSVKYSSPPAQIALKICKKGNETCLSVTDQGIGIPDADLPFIFDRFYTVDKARSRKSGGAGLGLSIVKTIVEKHGGSVSVESKIGTGSCFTIQLPLEEPKRS